MSSRAAQQIRNASFEKIEHAQLAEALSSNSKGSVENDTEFSPIEQQRIIRRIDRRLIITCGIMYCVSLMDRINLSAAAIAGMDTDLHLYGFQYVGLLVKTSRRAAYKLPVHHRIGFFRDICAVSAASNRFVQENWPAPIPGIHHLRLGRRHCKVGLGSLSQPC